MPSVLAMSRKRASGSRAMHSITRSWLVRKLQSATTPTLPLHSRNILLVSWDQDSVAGGHHGADALATDASVGGDECERTGGQPGWSSGAATTKQRDVQHQS